MNAISQTKAKYIHAGCTCEQKRVIGPLLAMDRQIWGYFFFSTDAISEAMSQESGGAFGISCRRRYKFLSRTPIFALRCARSERRRALRLANSPTLRRRRRTARFSPRREWCAAAWTRFSAPTGTIARRPERRT